MTPSKREEENERARQQFRRRREKLLSLITSLLERLAALSLARTLVIITLFLWLLLLVFGVLVMHQPQVAILPLYALYPGEIASGEPGYNPTLMHAWGIGAGVVLLALAIFATRRRKKSAAFAFMALFLISTAIVYGRVVAEVRHLN